MKQLRKFFDLPSTDRKLFLEAGITIVAIKAALWVLPFRTLRRLRATDAVKMKKPISANTGRVAWAVSAASRYVPQASCLTQALTARSLLARRCCPASLSIGVARGSEGRLKPMPGWKRKAKF